MDKFTLPPSPNWNQSYVLACNDNGLLAYGSRSEIAFLDTTSKEKFNVRLLNMVHKDKINVVVFSPSTGSFKNCLASCGDDGVVRVWDFSDFQLMYLHSGHKDGVKITGLDWSRADTNRIVSVNDLGSIVCWDLASNTIRSLHCGLRVLPLCLACCPHNKDIIAIGCRGGNTLVIDIKGNGNIIHKMRGHDKDVISISWCPVPYNVIKYQRNAGLKEDDTNKERELLLATGGTDRSIFIWRTSTDGRYELVINLPNSTISTNQSRKKGIVNNAYVLWTCVLWVDAFTLLSTSIFGEVLAWDLKSTKGNNKKPFVKMLHSKHHKGTFAIACPVVYDTDLDLREDKRLVWSTAMEKHLVACTLSSGLVKLDIPTLGGIVYTMDICPLDPNLLAIGSSDGKIFIWNLCDASSLNITTYWKKIIGKVMAVCWHPSEENLLAFGTSDGHVGILEVGSTKPPTLLRLHHRRAVYRLCWAPPIVKSGDKSDNNRLVLFSVGDGDVFQYSTDNSEADKAPKSLNTAILNEIDRNQGFKKTMIRSDIAFNKSRFAVSCENGTVYIVCCETLKLLNILHPHKKLMNNLEWHPETVSSEDNISPYCDYLATSCDNIKVYNIPVDGQVELVATLTGHSEKIVGLAWSPHYNGRLLSSSYDCSVQVWDVPSQSCVGMYLGHGAAVMTALFSPLDPDIIISGSADNTVRLWASEQLVTNSTKPDCVKIRIQNASKERNSARQATELTVDGEKLKKPGKPSGSPDKSMVVSHCSTPANTVAEDSKKRQKNKSALFPVTGPGLNTARYFDLLVQHRFGSAAVSKNESEPPSLSDIGYLDFFGDAKAMRRLLMVEESKLAKSKHHMEAQQMALWRGDASQMIQEAIVKKQMSDWLVSIAPFAGFDVWEQACNAYANQLADCGDWIKAASYLLATHRIHEAVNLLADNKQFREAVAVARCRLPPDDPLAASVYTKWGHSARYQGMTLLAAHCYLAAGDMHTCIETLGCHKELKSLKSAAVLAQQTGNTELAASLSVECLTLSIAKPNFAVGLQLVALMPQYQAWSVWLHVAEQMSRVRNRGYKEVFAWLEGHGRGPFSLWDELAKKLGESVPGTFYQELLQHLPTNKTPEFDRDMWYYISGQVAAAYLAKLEAKPVVFLRHIVCALSAAFHYQTSHPDSLALILILFIISPNGLFAKDSIFKEEYGATEENNLMKSLRAFVCASIVCWMNENWDKVTQMTLLNEEKGVENGICQPSGEGDSNHNKIIMPFKMAWLPDLLTSSSSDVLDAKHKLFFLKKAQKKALQDVVAQQNIQKNSLDKKIDGKFERSENNGIEQKCEEQNSDKKNPQKRTVTVDIEKVRKLDENVNVQVAEDELQQPNIHVPTTSNSSSALVKLHNDNIDVATNKSEPGKAPVDVNDKTSIEKENVSQNELPLKPNCDNALEGKAVDCSKPTSLDEPTKLDTVTNLSVSKSVNPSESIVKCKQTNGDVKADNPIERTEDTAAKLKVIKELEEMLKGFESERVSVPSPFIAYMNMKYLIDNLISKQDLVLAQKIQENCDKLWKSEVHE